MMKRVVHIASLTVLLVACDYQEVEIGPTNLEWIEVQGGSFDFGSDDGLEQEKPAVIMNVGSFYLSSTEVSNRMFATFIEETGYVTDAEKSGGGSVFSDEWEFIKKVSWKHPKGIDSSIDEIMDHPVVMVSYNDAQAYCKWAGGRLPTEVEWEYVSKRTFTSASKMNVWTGEFPSDNTGKDGFVETAPVNSYEADSEGFYQLRGNVWEWCEDSYNFEVHDKWKLLNDNNQKMYLGASFDPLKNADDTLRVIKGGSFLCHPDNCAGYLPYARQSAVQSEAFFHIGFRVAKDNE
jgi:formylglycine-generating enzyme required for sulfatase activity